MHILHVFSPRKARSMGACHASISAHLGGKSGLDLAPNCHSKNWNFHGKYLKPWNPWWHVHSCSFLMAGIWYPAIGWYHILMMLGYAESRGVEWYSMLFIAFPYHFDRPQCDRMPNPLNLSPTLLCQALSLLPLSPEALGSMGLQNAWWFSHGGFSYSESGVSWCNMVLMIRQWSTNVGRMIRMAYSEIVW